MSPRSLLLSCPFLLIAGLAVALPGQSASQAEKSLSARAYAILEKRCGKCHDRNGAQAALFNLRDHKAMLDRGQLTPKKPADSRIFVRAALSPDDPMPPKSEKNPVTAEEIAVLKVWIEAGTAEPGSDTPVGERTFLTESDILKAIAADLASANERERPFLRYFTLTHLANAGASEVDIQAYRVGLSKLLNSLSWKKEIAVPKPIDPARMILRIDLRKYAWNDATWKRLLAAYPYAVTSHSSTAKSIYETTRCDLPYVRADWFVAQAALPPLYHDLLALPQTAGELERDLKVDIAQNFREETLARAGFSESGVSANNRIVERHESAYGAYWRSYDFGANSGKQNIFKHPLDFEAAGGEIIFNLPNGLQAYLLVDGKGKRIDTGPIEIVSNKENLNDPVVRNGLTCMSCHAQGMKRFDDRAGQLRQSVLATPKAQADYDHDKALAVYVDGTAMKAFVDADARRFAEAVRATGSEVGEQEPIVVLARQFSQPLRVERAAAELWLPEAVFKARLSENGRVGSLLSVLRTAGGAIKRDAWEEYFGEVVRELNLGTYVKPTVVQQIVKNDPNNNGGRKPDPPIRPGKTNPKDGAELVFIPAGKFTMGSNDYDDAKPPHEVTMSAYVIYKNLVTVGQYEKFCKETNRQMPPTPSFNPNWSKKDHPIVNVTWDGARAYCQWAGGDLPTEAQWEYAARGTDGRKFPWGNEFDRSRLWASKSQFGDAGGTAPVGSYPSGASPFGVLDMAGNVWQWCLDYYDEKFYSSRLAEIPNPKNETPGKDGLRVLRGGSWYDTDTDPSGFRCACRGWYSPTDRLDGYGFRCVLRERD